MDVSLVAVEQKLWSGKASLVSAQTTEGSIGIMAGHEPVLGQLVEGGTVAITTTEGKRIVAAVHGGFLSVTDEAVRILVERAEFESEINADDAKQDSESDDESTAAWGRARLRALGQID